MTDTPFEFLDSEQMAKLGGLETESFRVALSRARTNRKKGRDVSSDVPEPDHVFGRSPLWLSDTAQRWVDARIARDNPVREAVLV
jgi:hypothetical protein